MLNTAKTGGRPAESIGSHRIIPAARPARRAAACAIDDAFLAAAGLDDAHRVNRVRRAEVSDQLTVITVREWLAETPRRPLHGPGEAG